MIRIAVLSAVIVVAAGSSFAATPSRVKMWNLTRETLSEIQLAPAGTTAFGINQALNDRDKTVDFDEQVRVTDTPPGRYDLRLGDVKGQVCFVRNVDVPAEGVFSVGEKELVDCAR